MSGATVDIERLNIALHGVSAAIAEAAVAGLESALRRRLGAMSMTRALDVPALRIDALDLPPGTDSAVLRDLLADRLVQAVGNSRMATHTEEDA